MKINMNANLSLLPIMLFVLFLSFKLAHIISWKWVWIFSPLWIPISIIIVLLGIITAIVVIKKMGKR